MRHTIASSAFVLSVGPCSAIADTAPEIARKAYESTLVVYTEDEKGLHRALASAFFIRDGEIATNYHVVEGAMRAKAKLVDTETEFVVLGVAGTDKEHDLAILKVSGPKTPFLPIGDSDAAQIGETVYAVGSSRGLEGTFSQGIISGKRLTDHSKLLQITAPTSPGSSGGPVMNEKGEVVGIVTALFDNGQNFTSAVPSNHLKTLLSNNSRKKSSLDDSKMRGLYPWHLHVRISFFWVGERQAGQARLANTESSWRRDWVAEFGGSDEPVPSARIANFASGEFRPKGFVPRMNPFYVALPYNDVIGSSTHKSEASRVIPWFARMRPRPGDSVCKDRWVQIYNGSRSCFAQWEDCGPSVTDDWEYVFGNKKPKGDEQGAAGISLSPAIRDYLGVVSGGRVHWRFVEEAEVPYGPWTKYGPQQSNPQVGLKPGQQPLGNKDLEAKRRYLEYLRRIRDETDLKSPMKPSKE